MEEKKQSKAWKAGGRKPSLDGRTGLCVTVFAFDATRQVTVPSLALSDNLPGTILLHPFCWSTGSPRTCKPFGGDGRNFKQAMKQEHEHEHEHGLGHIEYTPILTLKSVCLYTDEHPVHFSCVECSSNKARPLTCIPCMTRYHLTSVFLFFFLFFLFQSRGRRMYRWAETSAVVS